MADWHHRKVTTTYFEYVVPVPEWRAAGADWNQVQQALNEAVRGYRVEYKLTSHQEPPDDAIKVCIEGDEIVIRFREDISKLTF
jgi:hypothetical protein